MRSSNSSLRWSPKDALATTLGCFTESFLLYKGVPQEFAGGIGSVVKGIISGFSLEKKTASRSFG